VSAPQTIAPIISTIITTIKIVIARPISTPGPYPGGLREKPASSLEPACGLRMEAAPREPSSVRLRPKAPCAASSAAYVALEEASANN